MNVSEYFQEITQINEERKSKENNIHIYTYIYPYGYGG